MADVVNLGAYEDNISLSEGRKLFPGTTVLGGLESRGGILSEGTEDEIEAEVKRLEVKRLIEEQGKRRFMIGADCTLTTGEDYESIRLVSEISKKL